MPKLTKPERQYLKGIVVNMAIEKNTDQEILEFLKTKGIEVSRGHITHVRNNVQKSAEKWYNELRKSRYLYIAHFKERIDTTYKVEKKLWDILNDPESSKLEQVKACTEIRNNEIFLSNLYDIARYLTERIEKDGSSTNNEPLHTEGETEGTRTNLSDPIPAIE